MSHPARLRRHLALLAAVSLALVGGVVGAAPATAAPGTLTVDPVTPTSRAVTFSGAGSEGGEVALSNEGATVTQVSTVGAGRWSATLVFPAGEPSEQTVTIVQTVEGFADDPDRQIVEFVLPDTQPVGGLFIEDPDASAPLTSPVVTFRGTAPAGSTVILIDDLGNQRPTLIGESGEYSDTVRLSVRFGQDESFTFTGRNAAGEEFVPVVITVRAPDAIPAPVVTSPVTGATLSGRSIVFSGTGVPGVLVQFFVIPADEATLEANGGPGDSGPLLSQARTGSDGRWSKVLTVPDEVAEGNYIFDTVHISEVVDVDGPTRFYLSEPSNAVEFSVRLEQTLAATG